MRKIAVFAAAVCFVFFGCNTGTNGGDTGGDPVLVSSVSLNKTSAGIAPGQSETLTAEVLPADASNKTLEWTSGDEAVATVDSNGKVTVNADASPGATAEIKAAAKDGSGKFAVCAVTVSTDSPGNGETTIGGGKSDIGQRLYLNGAELSEYNYDTKEIKPFVYDGTLDLLSNEYSDGFYNMQTPVFSNLPAKVSGNKLFFDIGAVPVEKLSPLVTGLASVPANIKGVLVSRFSAPKPGGEYWEEYSFGMINRGNVNERIGFVYVEQDATVEGVANSSYWDLDLKAGWNTVRFDYKSSTVKTFVPDANYIWLMYAGADSGGDAEGRPLDIQQEGVTKLSGTVDVSIGGLFPEGGAMLKVNFFDSEDPKVVPVDSSGSWEITGLQNPHRAQFTLDISPNENTIYHTYWLNLTSFNYPATPIETNPEEPPEYEISGITFDPISITPMSVLLTVRGSGADTRLYANSYPSGSDYNYEMNISDGDTIFVLPDTLGRDGDDENWLWFRMDIGNEQYISKGRVRVDVEMRNTLDKTQMYKMK